MAGVLVALGLSLPAPVFYGKLSWFPWSPALGFKLRYVFLVMWESSSVFSFRFLKMVRGCEILSYAIWCLWWFQPWSSAYRVSWRSVEGWVEGRGWSHHLLLLRWYWQKRDRKESAFSSYLSVIRHCSDVISEKKLRGWKTHFAYSSRKFSPSWWVGYGGQEIEVNSTWKKPR